MRLAITLLVLTLASTGLGCDLIDKAKKAAKEAPSAAAESKTDAPQPVDPDDPDAPLGMKLNHPIECINHLSPSIMRSRSRYYSWNDPKTGPTGKERVVYGLYTVAESHHDRCNKELGEFAKKKEPATPDLDKVVATYQTKADAVVPLVNAAAKYYDDQDYEDDKFAKAKEMHAGLVKAFDEFSEADKALRAEIGKLKTGMDERELARIEKKEGKKLLWHSRKLGSVAKALVQAADEDFEKLDLAKLEGALKDYETIVNDTEAYASSHKDEVDKVMMYSSFLDASRDLVKATKALVRRKRDKKPWQQGEIMMINGGNPQMVEGHPAHVVDTYNALIERSNNLRW